MLLLRVRKAVTHIKESHRPFLRGLASDLAPRFKRKTKILL